MNILFRAQTKLAAAAVILLTLFSIPAAAQNGRIQIDNLAALEAKADDVVDVTIDGSLLEFAAKVLEKDSDADAKRAHDIVAGLKGIYVKSYTFPGPGGYSPADVESIRAQLKAPGWQRMVNVHSKREGDIVEVYMYPQGNTVGGLAILAAEPKNLTVVNIVGTIDVDRLSDLDGNFGIPSLKLERQKTPEPKTN